jgi:hypothetical protein
LAPESRIIVVCRTSDEELPCERHLATVRIKNWPSDRCEKCATHPRIHVDPQTYELKPHLEGKSVVVGLSKAREKSAFWSMVSRQQAVQLHVSVSYTGTVPEINRHFSVLLDTKRMYEDLWFRQKCQVALKKLDRPDLILIPRHRNSEVVAQLCSSVFDGCQTYIVPSGALEADLSGPLCAAKKILIADDAIVTGQTIFNFRSAIYRVVQGAEAKPGITVFVMVSRPPDRVPIESIERRYRFNDKDVPVVWGEEVFLPEEQHCPWCKEASFLRSVVELLPADATEARDCVRLRIEQLRQWPLEWPFFMLHESHNLPPNPRAIGSFFGTPEEPLRPHAAFAAGACVAQTMKMELSHSSRVSKKVPAPSPAEKRIKAFASKNWLLERIYMAGRVLLGLPLTGEGIEHKYADMRMVFDAYFETTLLSSLLRTFDAVEVRHAGVDDIFERKLRVADPIRTYPGAVTELAYATISNKIPSKAIRATLERCQGQDKWFRMFLAIMNAVETT